MLKQVGVKFKSSKHGVYSAVFECSCGRRKVMMVTRVRRGESKTCGLCNAFRERPKKLSRLRIAWNNMIARCEKINHPDYKNYGGRGICVAEEWKVFSVFADDMGEPAAGMTLERIDNTCGYSVDNCRWASHKQQARNKRNNAIVRVGDRRMTLAEAAEILGVDRRRVREHLKSA